MDTVKLCVCGRKILEEGEEYCYVCRMNKKISTDKAERCRKRKEERLCSDTG